MRPALVIAGAAGASALAAWLLPASIHIVAWDESGPQRVAVVAPLWRLILGALTVASAAATLWRLPPMTREARTRRAAVVAPLLALFLCSLPYAPWLADRVPVLLVLAGPLRWLVIAAAVGATIARLRALRPNSSLTTWRVDRRLVFFISLALYVALGLRSFATIGLKGDEPHYLIISQSLWADGDLQIENNHRGREYRSFTREELPPDFMQRGQNRQIYSIHAPGLPALLLPFYAAAGAYGALLALCAAGAVAALGVFELAAVVASPAAARATWAGVALTVPFIPYAWSVFPEIAGAAIVAWAALWFAVRHEVASTVWMARALALALLPWLHTKFVIFEAAFALLLAWRLRHQPRALVAFAAPIALSGMAWLGFFYVIYGTPNPEAPYGNYAREWVRLAFVPRGLLGLLFDQKFGLLAYAPVYALSLLGLWVAARHREHRWLTWTLTGVAVVSAVSSARLYMWWGGWSAPARFLVPALPLLAPAIALAIDHFRATRLRWTIGVLLLVSLATSLASALVPGRLLLFSDAHGVSRLAEFIQGSAPLTATLPMFTESEWRARDLIPRAYTDGERRASAVRGRVDLLERAAPARRAFDYRSGRLLSPDEWRATGTLTNTLASPDAPAPLAATGIYTEGESFWTMGTAPGRVLVPVRGARTADVSVHIGPSGGVCRTSANGETRSDRLQANETRIFTFDGIPAAAGWLAVTVQASDTFRPADVDPQSGDQRLLGCQVRIALR